MNRSILIVMCDFLVSAMLSMLIGLAPARQAPGLGYGAILDNGSTALIVEELRRRGEDLEAALAKLRELQSEQQENRDYETEIAQLQRELAETLARTEMLESRLDSRPDNTGALTPEQLQAKLAEEIRKRNLAAVQHRDAMAELDRMRHHLQSVSGNLASLNTDYAVSRQQLEDVRQALMERENRLESTAQELGKTREELAVERSQLSNVRATLEVELQRLEETRSQAQNLETDLTFTKGRLSAAERDLADIRSQAERARKLAESREIESKEAQRQLADAREMLKNAVGELSRTKSALNESQEAAARLTEAKATAERNLAEKQGQADTAAARLEAARKELSAAEEKLRSDVLERYGNAAMRLNLQINEKRLLLDQKAGGLFYMPLVWVGGKIVMPGFHRQMFGDSASPLFFDRIDRLDYRVNMTERPLEDPGTRLRGPMLSLPGEPRIAALEFNVRGRQPLNAMTLDALKQRGLEDLFLFKTSSLGKESAPLGGRCSLDLASNDGYLYVRNTGRGAGTEMRAEPGDFVMTKQGDFVGIVVSIENFDMGRRQEAKCFVFPANFSWDGAVMIPFDRDDDSGYYEEFGHAVKHIRREIQYMD